MRDAQDRRRVASARSSLSNVPASFVLAAALLLAPVSTFAQSPVFAGCQSLSVPSDAAANPQTGSFGSRTACGAQCWNSGFIYGYYASGSDACYCSNTGPNAGDYQAAPGGSDQCGTDLLDVMVTRSTFSFLGCYTRLSGNPDDIYTSTTSPEECFQACKPNARAGFQPPASGSGAWTCACASTSITGVTAVACGAGRLFIYEHTPDTDVGSTYVKRKLRERLHWESEQSRLAVYCPVGKVGCNVDAGGGAFECIDTKTELESCGGCINGEYNAVAANRTAAAGVDCSALPGVRLGGVTCDAGRCAVSACKPGWVLHDGRCRRKIAHLQWIGGVST